VQAYTPAVLADCQVFTYGRVHSMQESAFVYGWAANSGLAVSLWLLARLGGAPLRSANWTQAGAVFWNLGLLVGLVGTAIGDGTSVPYLRLPHYVQPILLVAFAAMAMPGVLAFAGRRHRMSFASQWYALAALFLFPWLFSAAQAMLVWLPMRGVLQAVAAGWFAQGLWTLWLAPLALAAAYYLVPKITGQPVPSYDLAAFGFWTLLAVGGWTGGRHLIGGPVPAWFVTTAIVSCTLLLIHYMVVAINLRGVFGQPGTVLKFVSFGLGAYLLGGLVDAVVAMRGVAVTTQFTWFEQAQVQLAMNGAFSMIIFGAIYFLTPRITGKAWPSAPLIRAHFASALLGTTVLVVTLAAAGWIQGRDLANAAATFADISAHTRPWLQTATAAQALLMVGNALLALHFIWAAASKPAAPAATPFSPPPTMEASAS
jgi:cytochrome c oxidase cbb3-type subunit 1